MKSTIKVELGPLNQPVIRMRIHHTDDVRDQLFVQFKEKFAGISNTCSVKFDDGFTGGDPEGLRCILEIAPMAPNELHPALIKESRIVGRADYPNEEYALYTIGEPLLQEGYFIYKVEYVSKEQLPFTKDGYDKIVFYKRTI